MKILYDSQIFEQQKFGGISRYFYELSEHSKKYYQSVISCGYTENEYVKGIVKNTVELPSKYFFGRNTLIKYTNSMADKRALNSREFDVFHPTYYSPVLIPKTIPMVVTVYDMIHELFSHYYDKNDCTSKHKLECFRKAKRIIAISENTKKDLLNIYRDIPEDRVSVVYLGTDWEIGSSHNMSVDIEGDYILFTGNRNGYKNFQLFVQAISPILRKYNMQLVLTGSKLKEQEVKLLENEGIAERTKCFFADDVLLKALYENAVLFVFPSLYEGFGLPILEAFASQCPIALSNTSCFPEIAGEAGAYFDPCDCNSIRNTIEEVIVTKSLRDKMIDCGVERVKRFSIEAMVEGTSKVYTEAVS